MIISYSLKEYKARQKWYKFKKKLKGIHKMKDVFNKKNNKIRKIAVFGGSFNPTHIGHFEMAKYIYNELKVDELWFSFSENRLKDASQYAPIHHRLAMGELMAKNYPEYNFKMKNIEDFIGTNITFDVLEHLRENNPNCEFIWVMGADNLAILEKWKKYDEMMHKYKIAVVDRLGYTDKALNSFAARSYAHLKCNALDLVEQGCGWCFLDNPKIDMSSSKIVEDLKMGKADFKGKMKEVGDYRYEHRLYGTCSSGRGEKTPNFFRHFFRHIV